MSTTEATRLKSYEKSKVDESLQTQDTPAVVDAQNKGSVCLERTMTISGVTAATHGQNSCILRAGQGGMAGMRVDRPHLQGPRSKGSPSPPHHHHSGPIVTCNAARERTRVKTLRSAFHELQQALPCVPPNTKLSKLDVLVLATMYISHLMGTLQQGDQREEGRGGSGAGGRRIHQGDITVGCHHWSSEQLHPVKKWPMRTRLYAGLAARARGSPPAVDTYGDHQAADTNIYL